MQKLLRNLFLVLICVCLVIGIVACKPTDEGTPVETPPVTDTTPDKTPDVTPVQAAQDDIVVLFTNDVHCDIESNIGYAGLAAYKNAIKAYTDNVAVVDCGDAIQGQAIGTISKGELIIDIMNAVGYDYTILGNHEFDYGMEQLSRIIEKSNSQYLACNIKYSGSNKNLLEDVKPYEIREFGNIKVAFVGVSTPDSLTTSNPDSFKENGQYVYDFNGKTKDEFYATVQNTIDECRTNGADYVVVLSHLGDDVTEASPSSTELAQLTKGIDAILDGHAHHDFSSRPIANKEGKTVIVASTGTKLNAIGQLVITSNGLITTTIITQYTAKDTTVQAAIDKANAASEDILKKVVAHSDIALSTKGEDGARMVRNRETQIGNLCADAYRAVSGADIAVVNGGGIRADLPQGDITYQGIINIHPFGNVACLIEATGQQIIDMLELGAMKTAAQQSGDGNAVGESGGFMQVSGLKFTINTTVESTVVLDENKNFVEVAGTRRVEDVKVLKNGEYVDIDVNATYTLASHNYMLKSGGDGFVMFKNNKILMDEFMIDNQVLITYITEILKGNVSEKYSAIEGRITIK